MVQGEVMDGSVGAGRGCCSMSSPNPGMGNAGILLAETSQQGSPQMGGQASLRGAQPGAMNKDEDLGIARNNTEDHEHKMEKPGNNQQAAATQSPAGSRHLAIQSCLQSLVHACQCHNDNCSVPSCQKMKRIVQHTKGCKRKTSGECPVCKQLIALCYYHAKRCQDNQCLVPFCLNIKHKLPQQELQHRIRQAQMEKPGNNQQAAATQSPAGSRYLTIQSCLVHACQCHNDNCSVPFCQKMKRVVQHAKGCKRKTSGECPVCKQLIALCYYHAKCCQDNQCLVPFCLNIRHKLRRQELEHRIRQAQMLRRMMKAPTGG